MKTVLVSGGTGQIGKEIVKLFLKNNYYVYIHGSNKNSLKNISNEFKEYTHKFEVFLLDAAEISDVLQIKDEIKNVDILINAIGGGGSHDSWENTTLEKWNNVYALNVLTPVYLIKQILETMKQKDYGRIINIASISSIKTLRIGPEYSAAKAAMVNLSQSLAQECKNTKITVNTISPGLVYTDAVKNIMSKLYNLEENENDEKINQVISDNFFPNLLQGLPTTYEISKLVEFLVSENAKHITGQNLIIDSGYTLSNFVDSSVE
jgi:3-oxoacyl-[acyl-carrier protein] reductase